MDNVNKMPVITAIIDENSGIITAFFNEIPGLMVQAKNRDEAKRKLIILKDSYLKRIQAIGNNFDINPQTLA